MKTKSKWHLRDADWELPAGDQVRRETHASRPVPLTEVSRIKKTLAKPAAATTKVSSLPLSKNGLTLIGEEMASLDQAQVDFNLLGWTRLLALHKERLGEAALNQVEQRLNLVVQSVVKRFHPSLTLLVLNLIEELQPTPLNKVGESLRSTVTTCLSNATNCRRLIEALQDRERSEIAQRLLPLVAPEQFGTIIDLLLKTKNESVLSLFIKSVLKRKLNHGEIFWDLGKERIVPIFGLLSQFDWEGKQPFFTKCLRSQSEELILATSRNLFQIEIKPEYALDLFRKFSPPVQEVWRQTFKATTPPKNWRLFLVLLLRSPYWIGGSEKSLEEWVDAALTHLGTHAAQLFDYWVGVRNYLFWPRYPSIREKILWTILSPQYQNLRQAFDPMIKREARVRFQDKELRTRLKARARLIK